MHTALYASEYKRLNKEDIASQSESQIQLKGLFTIQPSWEEDVMKYINSLRLDAGETQDMEQRNAMERKFVEMEPKPVKDLSSNLSIQKMLSTQMMIQEQERETGISPCDKILLLFQKLC
ncbi:hypothetical protein QAD02_023106 [Eretmocerus hayati]|uniref:Uncharacterized protein n=1 Tax=Eretmocerus hayati TaxID=131215 RepID=A0ACC2PY89_9HYME|nr:hypothetical protein QAD02_023106 [Eretmocerus hayati]